MKRVKINGFWRFVCDICNDQFKNKRLAKDHAATCQFLRELQAMEMAEALLPFAQMIMQVAVDAAIQVVPADQMIVDAAEIQAVPDEEVLNDVEEGADEVAD